MRACGADVTLSGAYAAWSGHVVSAGVYRYQGWSVAIFMRRPLEGGGTARLGLTLSFAAGALARPDHATLGDETSVETLMDPLLWRTATGAGGAAISSDGSSVDFDLTFATTGSGKRVEAVRAWGSVRCHGGAPTT